MSLLKDDIVPFNNNHINNLSKDMATANLQFLSKDMTNLPKGDYIYSDIDNRLKIQINFIIKNDLILDIKFNIYINGFPRISGTSYAYFKLPKSIENNIMNSTDITYISIFKSNLHILQNDDIKSIDCFNLEGIEQPTHIKTNISYYHLSVLNLLKYSEYNEIVSTINSLNMYYANNTKILFDYNGFYKHLSILGLINKNKLKMNNNTRLFYQFNDHINTSLYITDKQNLINDINKYYDFPYYYVKDLASLRLLLNNVNCDNLGNNLNLKFKIPNSIKKRYSQNKFNGQLRNDVLDQIPLIVINYNMYELFLKLITNTNIVVNRVIYDIIENDEDKTDNEDIIIKSLKYYILEGKSLMNYILNPYINKGIVNKPYELLMKSIFNIRKFLLDKEISKEDIEDIYNNICVYHNDEFLKSIYDNYTCEQYNINICARNRNILEYPSYDIIEACKIPTNSIDTIITNLTRNDNNNINKCKEIILQNYDINDEVVTIKVDLNKINSTKLNTIVSDIITMNKAKQRNKDLITRLSVTECIICACDIKEPVITTCCKNKFCLKCLIQACISSNYKCPLCRAPIELSQNIIYVGNKFKKPEITPLYLETNANIYTYEQNFIKILNYIKQKENYKIYILHSILINNLADILINLNIRHISNYSMKNDKTDFYNSSWLNCYVEYVDYRYKDIKLFNNSDNVITDIIIDTNSFRKLNNNFEESYINEKLFNVNKKTTVWKIGN